MLQRKRKPVFYNKKKRPIYQTREPTPMEIASEVMLAGRTTGTSSWSWAKIVPDEHMRFTDWVTPKPKPKPKHNKRVGIGNSLRFKIFMRDTFTCQYCGVNKEEDGVKLEIDHIVPVSKGGTNKKSNLTTACFKCNRGKSNKIIPDTKGSDDKETTIEATICAAKIVNQRPRDASLRSTEIDLTSIGSSSLMSAGTLTLGARDSLTIADSGTTTLVFDNSPITTVDTSITTRASGR